MKKNRHFSAPRRLLNAFHFSDCFHALTFHLHDHVIALQASRDCRIFVGRIQRLLMLDNLAVWGQRVAGLDLSTSHNFVLLLLAQLIFCDARSLAALKFHFDFVAGHGNCGNSALRRSLSAAFPFDPDFIQIFVNFFCLFRFVFSSEFFCHFFNFLLKKFFFYSRLKLINFLSFRPINN